MQAKKFINQTLIAGTLALGAISINQAAQATTFVFERAGAGGGPLGDTFEFISTSYNTDTEELSWSTTFTEQDGVLPEGAWLVISPGTSPNLEAEELTIFYLDSLTNNLTAYVYGGPNSWGPNPWEQTDLLASWTDALQVEENGNQRTLSFSVDVSSINDYSDSPDWLGAAFGEEVGIWFHALSDLESAYNDDGSLSEFSYFETGWFDRTSNLTNATGNTPGAEKVPEPSLVSVLGLGVIGFLGKQVSKLKKKH